VKDKPRELPAPGGRSLNANLQRTLGSIQQYLRDIKESSGADRYRPNRCPLCQARCCFLAHGFYYRTIVHLDFDDSIPVRRYLCRLCRRTVSRLPDFVLPYLRHSILIIGLFLVSRLLGTRSLREAARAAVQPGMPYQRGQFWVRRFRKQAFVRRLSQLNGSSSRTRFRYPCPCNRQLWVKLWSGPPFVPIVPSG
jgi:Domain of unknown function (DUF6431)